MDERIDKSQYLAPKNKLKAWLFKIIGHKNFELFIQLFIIGNTITMCCEYDD